MDESFIIQNLRFLIIIESAGTSSSPVLPQRAGRLRGHGQEEGHGT